MSKYNDKDVEELVQAALNYCQKPDESVKRSDFQRLVECVQPFHPKPPRVGLLSGLNLAKRENIKAIELTDEVCERLGPSGGMDKSDIHAAIATGHWSKTSTAVIDSTDDIMKLIEDAGIKWEDTT